MSRRRAQGWTCRKVSNYVVCGHHNQPRSRKCATCGKPRPKKRAPAHAAILAILDYAAFVAINGGEFCGICGAQPSPRRRLDRDHKHVGDGIARGLLCWKCNKWLSEWMTPEWLRAAADYLDRVEERAKQVGLR